MCVQAGGDASLGEAVRCGSCTCVPATTRLRGRQLPLVHDGARGEGADVAVVVGHALQAQPLLNELAQHVHLRQANASHRVSPSMRPGKRLCDWCHACLLLHAHALRLLARGARHKELLHHRLGGACAFAQLTASGGVSVSVRLSLKFADAQASAQEHALGRASAVLRSVALPPVVRWYLAPSQHLMAAVSADLRDGGGGGARTLRGACARTSRTHLVHDRLGCLVLVLLPGQEEHADRIVTLRGEISARACVLVSRAAPCARGCNGTCARTCGGSWMPHSLAATSEKKRCGVATRMPAPSPGRPWCGARVSTCMRGSGNEAATRTHPC